MILDDEILIKRRVVNDIIRKEKPDFVGFYEKPKHAALFTGQKNRHASLLDVEYSRYFRSVKHWNEEFGMHVDAFLLHGRAWMQIEEYPSENNPFHFTYIQTQDLIHPISARHPEDCSIIARRYDLTKGELKEYAEQFDFAAEIVEEMEKSCFDAESRTTRVYNVFYKNDEGVVMHLWYSDGSTWDGYKMSKVIDGDRILVEAEEFRLGGRSQIEYPFLLARLETQENPRIIASKGYAFIAQDDQEASTNIWTAVVNGGIRASRLYPYVPNDRDKIEGIEPKQYDIQLQPGKITSQELGFLKIPWPGSEMINLAQSLGVTAAAERGQTDVAATNRRDSRKTATELNVSVQMADQMKSERLTGYAMFWRRVHNRHWSLVIGIVDNVSFMESVSEEIREALLTDVWTIEPGGSVEFLARQESIQWILKLLGLVQGSPMFAVLVNKLVELTLPQMYEELAQSVQREKVATSAMQALAMVPLDGMPPETQQQVQELLAAAEEMYGMQFEGPNRSPGRESSGGNQPGETPSQGQAA